MQLENYDLVLSGGRVIDPANRMDMQGDVAIRDGLVAAVGKLPAHRAAQTIDVRGSIVTPGIIDDHSHLGVYAAPGVNALSDGNEATNPSTPYVWAEHSVWPQDPQFPRNLAGGLRRCRSCLDRRT